GDGSRGDSRGSAGGGLQTLAASEERGKRRGVRAAGAMRGWDAVPLDRDLDVLLAVEEVVDRLVTVTAGDDHSAGAEPVQPLGQLVGRAFPGERLRLGQVGGEHRRARE